MHVTTFKVSLPEMYEVYLYIYTLPLFVFISEIQIMTDGREGALEMFKNTNLQYDPDMSVCAARLLLFLSPVSSVLPFCVPRRQSFSLKSISVVCSFCFSCLFRTAVSRLANTSQVFGRN